MLTQAAYGVAIIGIKIDDAQLRKRLSVIASKEALREINRDMGLVVLERTKDFLDEMSATRHKVADRLGAPHSKFLEYASGRLGGSDRNQDTVLEGSDEKSATIVIKNTPGLTRAWHDLEITPKNKRALTIPVNRIAHGKRVADLERGGHRIFRPKKTNILAEAGEGGRLRPLYALVKKVVVPKDEGLLPTRQMVREWALEGAETAIELRDRALTR